MLPKNTEKIILFLLKDTRERGFNINELSRLNGISVGSSFKILKQLEKEGIVRKEDISNAIHYTLDFKNQETIKICELLLMKERRELKGAAKLYAQDIGTFSSAEMILLFGSVLHKKEFQDVDALFMTDDVKKTTAFCLDITKTRTKPLVPLILKKEDLIRELKHKQEALHAIIKGCVIIRGETPFVEVIKDVHLER